MEYFAISEKILNFAVEFIHHLTEGNQRTLGQDALRPLLAVIDRTLTPMGARMLRRWLVFIFFRVLAGTSGHPANNRNFPIIPKTSKPFRKKWLNHQIPVTNKLYPHLCCLQYFLNTISPGNDMKEKVQTLLSLFSEVDVSAMGFPAGWEEEPLWK